MSNTYIATIDIGGSKIKSMVVNEKKEMTEYLDTPAINLVGREINNLELIKLISENIQRNINSVKNEGNIISAISIGSPGPIDSVKGTIENPPNLKGINNLPIIEELKKIFHLPVYLVNDADAALIGEYWLRAHRGLRNICYLTLSTGVGSSILKDGQIVPGSEMGHRPLSGVGGERVCSCGKLNHTEAYLGTKGLAEIYLKIFEQSALRESERYLISHRMRKGVADNDPKWLAVQDEYAGYLALFLKNILTDLSPEIIILGGGIIFGNKPLLAETNKKLRGMGISESDSIIELAELGHNVNLGAAKYAFDLLGA